MKKICLLLITILLICIVSIAIACPGDYVKVPVNVSTDSAVYAYFDVKYDKSMLQFISATAEEGVTVGAKDGAINMYRKDLKVLEGKVATINFVLLNIDEDKETTVEFILKSSMDKWEKSVDVIADTVVLNLAAHKMVEHEEVKATCSDAGIEAYWECSVCKKLFSDAKGTKEISKPKEIAQLKHNYIVYEEVPASASHAGYQLLCCSECKQTTKQLLPRKKAGYQFVGTWLPHWVARLLGAQLPESEWGDYAKIKYKLEPDGTLYYTQLNSGKLQSGKSIWSVTSEGHLTIRGLEALFTSGGYMTDYDSGYCTYLSIDGLAIHDTIYPKFLGVWKPDHIISIITGDITSNDSLSSDIKEASFILHNNRRCSVNNIDGTWDIEGTSFFFTEPGKYAKPDVVQINSLGQMTYQLSDTDFLILERISTETPEMNPKPRHDGSILGDVNNDGKVDGRDAIRLMKYLAGEIDEEIGKLLFIEFFNSDIHKDGKIDELDLLYLMKYLSGEIDSLSWE